MGEFSPFINEKKQLVYQRVKNNNMNWLSKSDKSKSSAIKNHKKFFSSLFINPK